MTGCGFTNWIKPDNLALAFYHYRKPFCKNLVIEANDYKICVDVTAMTEPKLSVIGVIVSLELL